MNKKPRKQTKLGSILIYASLIGAIILAFIPDVDILFGYFLGTIATVVILETGHFDE